MTWPADTPVLVLAHGRALVGTDLSLRLLPSARAAMAAAAAGGDRAPPPPEALARARAFLAAARSAPFTIGEDMREAVTEAWLAARRAAAAAAAAAAEAEEAAGDAAMAGPPPPPPVREDDLHRWLNLARLAALSWGEGALTPERWAWLQALEAQRLARG